MAKDTIETSANDLLMTPILIPTMAADYTTGFRSVKSCDGYFFTSNRLEGGPRQRSEGGPLPGAERLTQLVGTNSTRRFCARPSSVSLDATKLVLPKPR